MDRYEIPTDTDGKKGTKEAKKVIQLVRRRRRDPNQPSDLYAHHLLAETVHEIPSEAFLPPPIDKIEQPIKPKFSKIAVIGLPNAGKSSLVNALIDSKVSIVTRKAQTTRDELLGVLTEKNAQLAFVDTPGIVDLKGVAARRRAEMRAMVEVAWETMESADIILLVTDVVRRECDNLDALLIHLRNGIRRRMAVEGALPPTLILVQNKADLLPGAHAAVVRGKSVPELRREYLEADKYFDQHFLVSAATGQSVAHLRSFLLALARDAPWQYPASYRSALSNVELVEEIVREKILTHMNYEVPHQVRGLTVGWTALENNTLRIDHQIVVPSARHRKMLLGEAGRTIKNITDKASADLSDALGVKVFLLLHVRHEKRAV